MTEDIENLLSGEQEPAPEQEPTPETETNQEPDKTLLKDSVEDSPEVSEVPTPVQSEEVTEDQVQSDVESQDIVVNQTAEDVPAEAPKPEQPLKKPSQSELDKLNSLIAQRDHLSAYIFMGEEDEGDKAKKEALDAEIKALYKEYIDDSEWTEANAPDKVVSIVSKIFNGIGEVGGAIVDPDVVAGGVWQTAEGVGELVNIPKEAVYDPFMGRLQAAGIIANDWQAERIDIPSPKDYFEYTPVEETVVDVYSFMGASVIPVAGPASKAYNAGKALKGVGTVLKQAEKIANFSSKFISKAPGFGKAVMATEKGKNFAVRMAGSERLIKDFVKAEFLSTIPEDATESEIVERIIAGTKGGGIAVVFGPAFQGLFKGLQLGGKVAGAAIKGSKAKVDFITKGLLKGYAVNLKATRMLDKGLKDINIKYSSLSDAERTAAKSSIEQETFLLIDRVEKYLNSQSGAVKKSFEESIKGLRDDALKTYEATLEPVAKEAAEGTAEKVVEEVVEEVAKPLTAAERKAATAEGKTAVEEVTAKVEEAKASAVEGQPIDFAKAGLGDDFSLEKIFNSKDATLRTARLLDIKVTQEGSKKHLSHPELQEAIANKLGLPIPPGFGLKPSTIGTAERPSAGRATNVGRTTQRKEVQDMLINPKIFDKLDAEGQETVLKILNQKKPNMTLEEIEVEGLQLVKALGLDTIPAVREFAKSVDADLYRSLKALRALRFAQGRLWNKHYEKLVKAKESNNPELVREIYKDTIGLMETQSVLEANMGRVGAELRAFSIISDGTKPAVPKTALTFVENREAFNGFLRQMFGNQISINEAATKWATQQIKAMDHAFTDQAKKHYAKNAGNVGTLGIKVFSNYFINNMLIGVPTGIVNAVSPQVMAVMYTAEEVIGRLSQREFKKAFNAVRHMFSTPDDFWYAIRMAGQGFVKNRNPVEPRGYVQTDDYTDVANSVIQSTFGRPRKNFMERMVDYFYNSTGTPSRVLNATDTFNKAKAYKRRLHVELRNAALEQALAKGEQRSAGEIYKELASKASEIEAKYTKDTVIKEATKRANESGHPHASDEWMAVFNETTEQIFDPVIESAAKSAYLRATQETFTTPLTDAGRTNVVQYIGEFFQSRLANHWAVGTAINLNIPFKGVPTNMAAYWLDRQIPFATSANRKVITTDLARTWNNLISRYRDDFTYIPKTAAEKEAAGQFYAKAVTGAAMTTWAYGLATEGRITGGGPADPKARRMLEKTGWKSYSYRVEAGEKVDPLTGETYMSYNYISYLRADPYAAWLATVADVSESYKFTSGQNLDEASLNDLIAIGAMSAHKSLDDRSMARGVSNLGALMSSDDTNQKQVAIRNIVGNLNPGGSLTKRISIVHDDVKRNPNISDEVKMFVEFGRILKARTPGMSKEIDPVFEPFGGVLKVQEYWNGPSWFRAFTGKNEISSTTVAGAIGYSKFQDDLIAREVMRQWQPYWGEESGFPISNPSPILNVKNIPIDLRNFDWTFEADGVKRTWTMYSKYQNLAGTLENPENGFNQRQAIEAFIKTKEYQALPDFDPSVKLGENKISVIKKIQNTYRDLAKARMVTDLLNSDDDDMQMLGLYFNLSLGKAVEHIKKNPDMKAKYVEALDNLVEDKDQAAVEAGKLLLQSNIFE